MRPWVSGSTGRRPHRRARIAAACGLVREAAIGPGNRLGRGAGLRVAHDGCSAASPSLSPLKVPPGAGSWPMRHFLRWPRWLRRSPFAAMPSSALSARWGRRERRWVLRPSTPSCRRSRREPATPASPFPWHLLSALRGLSAHARPVGSWGLNFGWKASRALLFGLAVSGVSTHSPVVQGDPMGPFWLTGGAYGLDGSWLACLVLLAALPVVFRVTRDLNYRYNAPVIVPGGIPVDLDAAARAQHEAAMGLPRRRSRACSHAGADRDRSRRATTGTACASGDSRSVPDPCLALRFAFSP